ncbi:MAG: hypothetical protein ACRDPR_06620 [Nocardioidaceae bacterium]
MASTIEAYREQWGVDPDELRQPPVDGVQYREWSAAVHTPEMVNRLEAVDLEATVERGLGLGL